MKVPELHSVTISLPNGQGSLPTGIRLDRPHLWKSSGSIHCRQAIRRLHSWQHRLRENSVQLLTPDVWLIDSSAENSHAPEEEERQILYPVDLLHKLSHPFDEDVITGTV